METISEFLTETHLPENLVEAVVDQFGGWESFVESACDVARYGIDGGFGGFTYYSDTVDFAEKHRESILSYAKETCVDIGYPDVFNMIASFGCVHATPTQVAEGIYNPDSDERTNIYNALAWFAAEEVCRSYSDLVQ